jgi:hypothetical protein
MKDLSNLINIKIRVLNWERKDKVLRKSTYRILFVFTAEILSEWNHPQRRMAIHSNANISQAL